MNDKIKNICDKEKKSCLVPIRNNYTFKDGQSAKLKVENKNNKTFYGILLDGCFLKKSGKRKRVDWVLHNDKDTILFIELKSGTIDGKDLDLQFKESEAYLKEKKIIVESTKMKYILVCKRPKDTYEIKKMKITKNFKWFNHKEYVKKDITELFNF